ncbi:hypothetical protein [Williamsoniiplasma lucivorax]|uniref:Transposase n=1 Tax=Williamsoniiplasma lucivorax TaxID=209274 RepID=A0A2S5REQ9_9MOLU|nr:hypothetical protein [Williamsoniiplasma lucivorax]PPE05801.1 transposase [Williamsoniiplasma lucivorax]
MAKQWTKEEKIKILSELSSSNASTIAKKYNISRDSILRWNRQVKKIGYDSLVWGLGEASKNYGEDIKSNSEITMWRQMTKLQLIEELQKSKHLDLLSKSLSKKEKWEKNN